MKPVFLTFGEKRFYLSKFRLLNQAIESNWFSQYIVLDKLFLQDNIDIKKRINNDDRQRGFGYWIWKSFIIHKVLLSLNQNEILVYLDAGCSINLNASDVFFDYINLLENQQEKDLLCFMSCFTEKCFTKRDLFKHLNCDILPVVNTNQIIATLHIWKNTEFSRSLSREWYNIALNDNLIDDTPSKELNYEGFVEHRHDQSIFSLLVKKNKDRCFIFDDESYYVDFQSIETKQSKFPFFALRISDDRLF